MGQEAALPSPTSRWYPGFANKPLPRGLGSLLVIHPANTADLKRLLEMNPVPQQPWRPDWGTCPSILCPVCCIPQLKLPCKSLFFRCNIVLLCSEVMLHDKYIVYWPFLLHPAKAITCWTHITIMVAITSRSQARHSQALMCLVPYKRMGWGCLQCEPGLNSGASSPHKNQGFTELFMLEKNP